MKGCVILSLLLVCALGAGDSNVTERHIGIAKRKGTGGGGAAGGAAGFASLTHHGYHTSDGGDPIGLPSKHGALAAAISVAALAFHLH